MPFTNTRIIKHVNRPEKLVIEEFSKLSSATIDEAMGRTGALDSSIKTIKQGLTLCGPAVTVKCHPGDNLTLLKAIDIANEGDVLVVDMGDLRECGPWGEITTIASMQKGIAGLVINSAVRDTKVIRSLDFPIFSTGSCIKGTTKNSFGLINHPIVCGDILIKSGDLIFGDDDGVVSVKFEDLTDVLEKSKNREKKELILIERIKNGESLFSLGGHDRKLIEIGIE